MDEPEDDVFGPSLKVISDLLGVDFRMLLDIEK